MRIILIPLALLPMLCHAQNLQFEVQLDATLMPKNVVALPGSSGTKFALRDLYGTGTATTSRYRLIYDAGKGSEWVFLYAPLTFRGNGSLKSAVQFGGSTFSAGVATKAKYRFDSYRLTYRKVWRHWKNGSISIGGTLKVRDAEIRLEQGGTLGQTKNTGPVPLLHLLAKQELGGGWTVTGDLDFAAAPQGRATDLNLRLFRALTPTAEAFIGLRYFEGGADNPTVYSFAEFRSIGIGLAIKF